MTCQAQSTHYLTLYRESLPTSTLVRAWGGAHLHCSLGLPSYSLYALIPMAAPIPTPMPAAPATPLSPLPAGPETDRCRHCQHEGDVPGRGEVDEGDDPGLQAL